MKYFVGLDVSTTETAVCITDQDGQIVKETMVQTEPEHIAEFLQSAGLHYDRIGIEASNLSIWLCRQLIGSGFPIVCIETRHAKAAMAAQNVKTDRNDARAIAQMMQTGWYKAVHVKSDESQRLKMLVNNRKCLVIQRVTLENQIRGTLKVFGLKTGKVTRQQYDARIRELIAGDGELEAAVIPLLEVRALLINQIRLLEKMLQTAAQKDEVCKLLMTTPGVGPLTAVLYKAVIDDPARFDRSRDVPVNLGLTPRKFASGEVDYNGRITKCGDSLLRSHLFEAAAYILRPSARKSHLKSWGIRIAKRSSTNNARVAVARRLAIIMHRMWVDGTEFNFGINLEAQMAC
jgi:transposase